MNKGQLALKQKMEKLMVEVGKPFTFPQYKLLLDTLSKVSEESLWGIAIRKALAEKSDPIELVEGLASQALDDPMTMISILGQNATIYLLRLASYDMTIEEIVNEVKTNPQYEQETNV